MNDRERLTAFKERLESVGGLGERSFKRLIAELERTGNRAGYDDQGRLKVAMFDAKSYDVESFDLHNDRRFAFHWIQASLSQDTVHASEDCKAVCIFVNDQCDDSIARTLAAQGVELIALRRAGFNNVVVTSHQAFLTNEAQANIADTTLANITEYEQGRRGAKLTNAVFASE